MINIREADFGDIEDLFKWRNDEFSRQMLFHTDEIQWKDHLNWFDKTLTDKNIIILICTHKNREKIGVVHFTVEPIITKIGINLSTSYRGKGYAKDCIGKSIIFFKNKFPNKLTLCAQIKS